MTAYLSRATLRRNQQTIKALGPLLLDNARGPSSTGHNLVWSLFADTPERTRDFLWRESAQGVYYILSSRPPVDRHALFDLAEPKEFAPALASGDRLRFSLRANPVVRRRVCGGKHATKHDVVFDALRKRATELRASHRHAVIQEQGFEWLERQGKKFGFAVEQQEIGVDGYAQHRIGRATSKPMAFSTLDFEGVLTVEDPSRFLAAILRGFGAAKAYGCGLMLVRRARSDGVRGY